MPVDNSGKCYCDVYKDICTVVNSKKGFRWYLRLIRKEILHFPAYINWKKQLTPSAEACLKHFTLKNYYSTEPVFKRIVDEFGELP